jgi:serine/threonine protein kinase/plastocyanin
MQGTEFGRYRLLALLGRGGMGEVWRAHDTATDRVVAIKLLPAHFSENAEFQERFRREAHAAARLNTPHVIPIHDYGEIDGQLYVSMRLIEGRDLQTVLADGPLDPGRAVRIVEGVAKALHAAHKVGLVHRDVKPSNVLLDEDDFAYLIDFGIARAAAETRLTSTGNMIGTFQYMAPERFGSRQEDARADIYALACVLYECLTGQPPFAEDSAERLMVAHLTTPPPQPSSSQPSLPPQIDQVITTGMAKEPDNRYGTTIELADAARNAITVPIPRPTPSPAPNPPSEQVRPTGSVAATRRASSEPAPTEQSPSADAGVAVTEPAEWTNQPPMQQAPPGRPAPPKEMRSRRIGRRTKIAIGAVGVLVVVAVAVVAIVANMSSGGGVASPTSTTSAMPESTTLMSTTTTTTTTIEPQAGWVTINANGFSPQTVTVSPGADVCFKNFDSDEHDPIFPWQKSPLMFLGGHTASCEPAPVEPGSYAYHDERHPSLQGVLIVR